jgi:hypothetical protein
LWYDKPPDISAEAMLALGLTKGLEGLFDSAVRVLENCISLSILATNRHNEARSGVAPQTVRPLRSRSYGQRTLGFPIRSDVAWTRLISRNPSQAPHANGCRNTVCRLLCRSTEALESVSFSMPLAIHPSRTDACSADGAFRTSDKVLVPSDGKCRYHTMDWPC